jgi:hypothetical protein
VVAAAAVALFLRADAASEQFMEGSYWRFAVQPGQSVPRIHGEFHQGRFEFLNPWEKKMADEEGTYTLDGATLRLTANSTGAEAVWHYRSLDGVPMLLTARALAIIEKDGGLKPAHQNDFALWSEMMVRFEPQRPYHLYRLVREHRRFAAALPPDTRAGFETTFPQYLRIRWSELLADHPKLRDRLPKELRPE